MFIFFMFRESLLDEGIDVFIIEFGRIIGKIVEYFFYVLLVLFKV